MREVLCGGDDAADGDPRSTHLCTCLCAHMGTNPIAKQTKMIFNTF